MITVIELGYEDLRWSFTSEPKVANGHGYRTETVDPHPGNAHDASVVREMAKRAFMSFPVDIPVQLTISPYEGSSRTNGWTNVDYDYSKENDDDGRRPMEARIFLSGKRIAIHPAVTRYLVPHEYGHVVEEVLNRARGGKCGAGELLAEYAEMRGVKASREYSGRTHSLSPGEVFANDFRILVARAELEFWPHPGIARPESVPQVVEWWAEQVRQLRSDPESVAA